MTGSWCRRSVPSTRPVSPKLSRPLAASVDRALRNVAFSLRPTNTMSAVSDSSSTLRAIVSVAGHQASWIGRGGTDNVCPRSPHTALSHGGGSAPDTAPARSDRPADHRADDGDHSAAQNPMCRPSTWQGPGAGNVSRTISGQPCSDTLERQHEIDALSRKLARQDAAIERLRSRLPADLVRA